MRKTLILLLLTLLASAAYSEPSTVAVTYRFAPENEAQLRRVIDGHWSTVRKLDLVSGERRLYRGDGFFLEIFTWKEASIPAQAPREVLEWWNQMHALVKKDGLRIDNVRAAE